MNITWSVQKRRGQAQLQAKWASRWQNFHFGLTCPSSFFLLHCEWMFEGAFWENIKHSICQGTVSTGYKESLMCPLQFPSLASSSAYIDNKHIRLNSHTQEFNPSSHDQPFHLKVNTFAIVRTPGIVKGNNPLNLVWWGSQWLGILKDFPQSRCILISHWSREK